MTAVEGGFRLEARAFCAALPTEPPHASLEDRFSALTRFQRDLHAAGLAVVAWPERFGGRDLGIVEAAVVAEELGLAGAPEVINFVATDIIAPALLRFVDEARLLRWLPPMASASEVWCQLFSEPDAGSDLASLRTRAERDGDDWVINGTKVWSTWAQFARWGLLLARTGSPESRHRGITAFVVDMHAPGVGCRPLRTMTGECEFAEVHFDRVCVPAMNVVGEPGGGWAVALHMLAQERGPYAIRRASVLRGALARLDAGVRSRHARLDPTLRHELVAAVIAMRVLDLRIDRVVDQLSRDEDIGSNAAITKMLLGDAEQRIFAAAHHLLGAAGAAWLPGDSAARLASDFLYSRAATIYGGTAQIQRNLLAERALGLPREPS